MCSFRYSEHEFFTNKLFYLHQVVVGNRSRAIMEAAPARSSNMEAPIMLLKGHEGEVYTAKFHPEGQVRGTGTYKILT